ncbi:hypothetical protein ACNKHX_26620 [Shigella flexneri]
MRGWALWWLLNLPTPTGLRKRWKNRRKPGEDTGTGMAVDIALRPNGSRNIWPQAVEQQVALGQ